MYKHFFFFTALFFGALLSAQAQELEIDDALFEMSLESLMELKVVSASQQEETLDEVPVPITVITKEDIALSGARNLRDMLALFVPGMTVVQDHNEMNIAMRGVYASSQQKVLFLLNGHRLNSRAYSSANPDYSIALDKIEQIEVLRGPASSLYGNVSLTAVINIITRKGKELDGGMLSAGAGNYGQRQVNFLYGSGNDVQDFLLWGQYYQADGETREILPQDEYAQNPTGGTIYLERFRDRPSYDLGFQFTRGKLSFMANTRYSKMAEPFSAGGLTGIPYEYDAYRTFQGTGPGLGTGFTHLDAKYENIGQKWGLTVNPYADLSLVQGVLILNPANTQAAVIEWQEAGYGTLLQGYRFYDTNLGKGSFLFGLQLDHLSLYDSFFALGTEGEFETVVDNSENQLLERGQETIYSGFFQFKHNFSSRWLVNFGLRYDNKDRHQGENVTNISPRLALVYIPQEKLSLKLSYAQSFVDAPYWYRYNSLASYQGSSGLLPEQLQSLQLTGTWNPSKKWNYSATAFYSDLRDFVFRVPDPEPDAPRYENAGELESAGLEQQIRFTTTRFKAVGQLTYQAALSAEDYGVTDERIHNIPNFSGGLSLSYNPIFELHKKAWLNLNMRYAGSQLSPIQGGFQGGQPLQNAQYEVPGAAIFSLGVRVEDIKGFGIDARLFNALDTRYEQGGSTRFPYPQPGRWYMIRLLYSFSN